MHSNLRTHYAATYKITRFYQSIVLLTAVNNILSFEALVRVKSYFRTHLKRFSKNIKKKKLLNLTATNESCLFEIVKNSTQRCCKETKLSDRL